MCLLNQQTAHCRKLSKVQREAIALTADAPLTAYGHSSWQHACGRTFRNYWTIERLIRWGLLIQLAYGSERWLVISYAGQQALIHADTVSKK